VFELRRRERKFFKLGSRDQFFSLFFPQQIFSLVLPKKWDFLDFLGFFSSVNFNWDFYQIFDITKLKKIKTLVGKFLGFDFIIDFENWVYFRTMVFVFGRGVGGRR